MSRRWPFGRDCRTWADVAIALVKMSPKAISKGRDKGKGRSAMMDTPSCFSLSRPGVMAVLMAWFFVHCCSWVWASSLLMVFKKVRAAIWEDNRGFRRCKSTCWAMSFVLM